MFAQWCIVGTNVHAVSCFSEALGFQDIVPVYEQGSSSEETHGVVCLPCSVLV